MVAQSICEAMFSMYRVEDSRSRAGLQEHSPTQRVEEVPDHSAPQPLSKGIPGVGRSCSRGRRSWLPVGDGRGSGSGVEVRRAGQQQSSVGLVRE